MLVSGGALTFHLLREAAVCRRPGYWPKLFPSECPAEPSRRGGRRRSNHGEEFPDGNVRYGHFFNGERGYGFIKPDDGGRDVFVHITAVERAGLKSLNEGQRISFDVEPDKKGKGPKAVNLVVTG